MGKPLSEWLELMLAEIAQRERDAQLAAEEQARRQADASDGAVSQAAADAHPPSSSAGTSLRAQSPRVSRRRVSAA